MISITTTHLGALRRPSAGYVETGVEAVFGSAVAVSGGVASCVAVAKSRWALLPEFSQRQVNQLRTAPPVMTIDGASLSAPPERCP